MGETDSHVWTRPSQMEPRLDAEFYQSHFLAAERRVRSVPVKRFRSLWRNSNRIYIGIAGFTAKAEGRDYTPYIRPTDVGPHGEINWSRIAWCYAEWLEDYRDKGCAQPGDLLVEVKGNTRRVAVVDDRVPKDCIVSGSFWRLSLKQDVNPQFVLAFLLSETGQLLKRRWVSNSVVSWIDPHSFRSFLIPVPNRRVQDYIGGKVALAEHCRAVAANQGTEQADELEALYRGCPYDAQTTVSTIVSSDEIDGGRVDAWYHQGHFIALSEWLRGNKAFVQLEDVASLSSERWSPSQHSQSSFRYIEISNVDPSTGYVSHVDVPITGAPSRARKLVRRFDVLASTVRPNRGAVGIVPDKLDRSVATSGFAVVRATNKRDAYFLLAVLRHQASTAQLMRYNTGSAYPAIEESVLPQVWIPGANPEVRVALGTREFRRTTMQQMSVDLVNRAKADVEALLQGTLDVDAIQAGRVKPPTADDLPELTEYDT